MSNNDKPCRSLTVRSAGVAESFFVVHGREAFELGDVETSIWSLCDGTYTIGDISRQISAEFNVDEDVAFSDVTAFIAEMRDANLLER